jgi:ribokinase
MGRVFVIGSINQDYVLVVPRRPGAGDTVTAATLAVRGGGKGANQAAAAAAGGAGVRLLARVGDDAAAVTQRHDLTMRGVDLSLVAETAGVATGSAFITVTPDGENAVTVAPGANERLRPGDVAAVAGAIAESAVLVAQLETPLDAVAEAVALCGPDTHVLLNAAPYRALPPALLGKVDTLVVNEHEAALLAGAPVAGVDGARDAAAAIVGLGPRSVVVTLGAGGAVVATGGSCSHVRAPVVAVVDSTGAGDVLVGTLAALLADGRPLDDAVATAVEKASASVTWAGARPAITDVTSQR